MTIQDLQQKAVPILKAHGVVYAAVFGSVARGDSNMGSDVDLLIRYDETPSLITHIGVAQELEDALNTKVDLVTEKSLYPAFVPFIKKDLHSLYGQPTRLDLY